MEWLDKFTAALRTLLEYREALALIAGTLVSVFGTQYIKRPISNLLTRKRIVMLTLPLGFFPTYIIFPVEYGWQIRMVMGLVVGLASPYVYKAAIFLIGLKWPETAAKASADL